MSDPTRVLVIDDHRMFADALELLLAGEQGLESVGAAGSAEEALELCRRSCPDVVLMDVDLPGMDGIEATRALRRICPDSQVVVITALQQGDLIASAIEAGACGFVPKTQAAERLVAVIRRAAAGEMVLPEGDTRGVLQRLQGARAARSETGRLIERLTERELEILQGIADGKTTGELSEALFISQHTAQTHVRNILTKLGVHSKLEALLLALRNGLVRLPS